VTAKRPGKQARGTTTGRPIMVLLDVLGERWTLRILWELSTGGPATFRVLRERCDGISPTVLNRRLKQLRDLELVEHAPDEGYRLTDWGTSLVRKINPLYQWAEVWADALEQRTRS
jgi:DNA-binding HxlR family transcriptional regulator